MTKFEMKTCSRCGGSGKHSFNLTHGTMCYGCNGKGVQLTKRGKAAYDFFELSLTVQASELKIGMSIKESVLKRNFTTINEIHYGTDKELGVQFNTSYLLGPDGDKQMVLVITDSGANKFYPESRVRIFHTNEEKNEKIKLAVEYQSTLTVNGTVKTRKNKSLPG